MHQKLLSLTLGALLIATSARADGPAPAKHTEARLPTPAEVKTLDAFPRQVALKGGDASAQLILTGALASGALQDLTGAVQYEVADPTLARVTSAGRVIPLRNGTTTITARYGDKSAQVALKLESMDV